MVTVTRVDLSLQHAVFKAQFICCGFSAQPSDTETIRTQFCTSELMEYVKDVSKDQSRCVPSESMFMSSAVFPISKLVYGMLQTTQYIMCCGSVLYLLYTASTEE